MPDTEGHAGNDHSGFYAVFPHRFKEKSAEDHFLEEADAEHRKYVQRGFDGTVMHGHAVPEICAQDDKERHVVQRGFRRCLGRAKPVRREQSVFLQKQQKECRKQNSDGKRCRFFDTDLCGKRVSDGHQSTVGNDPRDCKPYFAFIVKFLSILHLDCCELRLSLGEGGGVHEFFYRDYSPVRNSLSSRYCVNDHKRKEKIRENRLCFNRRTKATSVHYSADAGCFVQERQPPAMQVEKKSLERGKSRQEKNTLLK